MSHELKIWPQYYEAVKNGSKTFEVRENDRAYQKGDTVRLRNYDPKHNFFLNEELYPVLEFKIGYVLPIDADRVVFSLLPITGELIYE